MKRLRAIFRERGGTATIEFALVSLFLFGTISVGLDFSSYVQQKLKLGNAVEQGAMLAFNTRNSIDTNAVATYVQTAAGLSAAPSVTCNDNQTCKIASARGSTDYRCLTSTGTIASTGYALAAACPSPPGGIAGYYLVITASKTFNSVIVPDSYLGGKTITQTAVVRLQ